MQPLTLAITPPVSSHAPWHLGQASRHFQEPCHESQSQHPQGFQDVAWLLHWLHSKTIPQAHDQQAAASTPATGGSIKPHRQHSKTMPTASRLHDASRWMRCLKLPPAEEVANAPCQLTRKPPTLLIFSQPIASVQLTSPPPRCAGMPSFSHAVTT